ncbi:MAG: DUF459 domain-containing protein [Hyphomicrobiales bacterium]
MTKPYIHTALYFASALFLSVSIGAISPTYADPSQPVILPKLKKKKTPKPVVEEVVEVKVEAKAKPKKRVVVRRRKDPAVLPRPKPSENGSADILQLAQFGGNEATVAENADNEAPSTLGNEASSTVDNIATSSVVLDQDQPKDANLSAAAASESAAGADALALLKAEIGSLKEQLTSEKANSAKLTIDLVRAKQNAAELTKDQQDAKVEAKEAEAAETVATPEVAEPVKATEPAKAEDIKAAAPQETDATDVKIEAVKTEDGTSALSDVVSAEGETLVDATKEAATIPKTAAAIAAEAAAKIATKPTAENGAAATDVKAAVEEAKTEAEAKRDDASAPSTEKVEAVTQEAKTTEEERVASEAKAKSDAEQAALKEKKEADAKKVAEQDAEAKTEDVAVAGAPTKAKPSEEPKVPSNPDAANATLAEGEEVAEADPALLLPFPRENPFERVIPKVAKGPLYIKKPPVNDTYNLFVLGDSLGSGLWQGLHQNFRGAVAPSVKVVKKAKANTGIVRNDRFDWMENMEKIANGGGFQIAVLMFGANDAQTIRLNGKRHHYGTPAWEQIYRQRIDRMVRALKRKKVAIYWVGLPNVRVPSLRKDYLHFNAIFKEKADEHGIHFVDTWDVTNDANGIWQSAGKTVRGKKAVLRAKDGTHFTSSGYRVLAQFPEKVLRPDINQARANRLAKGLRTKRTGG